MRGVPEREGQGPREGARRFTAEGAWGGVGLRGKEIGTMEQTNIQFGTPCQSDLDGDGEVKVADLLILIGAWGPCADCDADLDGDGEVKVADLLLLIGAWGACP